MAISYVGGVSGGRAGATSTTTQSISGTLTGGLASSPSQGDLIVVWCSAAGDGTGAPPNQFVSGNTSGAYQNEAMQSITTVTYDAYAALNWQFAGATPDTTITIPSSGNARNAQRWAIHVFRGVDTTNPRDVTSVNASGTASGRPNPGSITPVTSGAWILWLGHSAASTGAAYTAPTGFTTNWLGNNTVDTADCMDGFGYYTGWVSGAYDPAAITAGGTTNAADSWVAKTVALRPAPNAYTLTCNAGSYSVSGVSAGVNRNLVLTASAGSYSLSGVDAILTKGSALNNYVLTAQAGSYSKTGVSASINRGRVLTASAGSYALSGVSASLLRSKLIVGGAGSYSLTGVSATITYTPSAVNYTLTAQAGSYALTGVSANISKNRLLTASAGSFSVSGVNAGLNVGKVLTASAGSYTFTGQNATITRTGGVVGYTLTAQTGSYLIGADFWDDGYAEPGYAGNATITIGQRPRGASKAKIAPKKAPQRRNDDEEVLDLIMALVSAEYI